MNGQRKKYHFYHLPAARKKSIEQKIMKEKWDKIYMAQIPSKFRYRTNLDPNIYCNILKLIGAAYIAPKNTMYNNSKYIVLSDKVNFEDCKNCEMVCFNDTDQANKNFEQIKEKLLAFLERKFPEKCSFEKEII